MATAADYVLRVTAGPSYDEATHQLVNVNKPSAPTHIASDKISARITVRMKDFTGLPKGSPETAAYFRHPRHPHDLYSVAFAFTLKEPPGQKKKKGAQGGGDAEEEDEEEDEQEEEEDGIPANELVWGNDFDKPIRNNLPPGFGSALRIVRWAIDPGLDGDIYADRPYLYGPLASSINVLRVGRKEGEEVEAEEDDDDDEDDDIDDDDEELLNEPVWKEGAEGSGEDVREDHGLPDDGAKRMKHFLDDGHKKDFVFEYGREYKCDFFNPYLDFNAFALKLPGFTLPILRFWDGQPLRYVLKHKTADGEHDEELLAIVVMLVKKEEADEEEKKWLEQTKAVAPKVGETSAPKPKQSTAAGAAAPPSKSEGSGVAPAVENNDDDLD